MKKKVLENKVFYLSSFASQTEMLLVADCCGSQVGCLKVRWKLIILALYGRNEYDEVVEALDGSEVLLISDAQSVIHPLLRTQFTLHPRLQEEEGGEGTQHHCCDQTTSGSQ